MGPGSHPHVAYLGEFRLISELAFPLGHWVRPFRKLRLSEVSRWLDHLSSCSPCFQEFAEMRKEAVTQRRLTRLWLAFAVALIFAGGGWLWMRTRPSAQPPDTAVLDLRGISATRGESAGRSASSGNPSLVQTSDHGHCRSVAKERTYELTLVSETGAQILVASGTANLEDHNVTLRADVDVGGVRPGPCVLALRQPGREWSRYPVRIL